MMSRIVPARRYPCLLAVCLAAFASLFAPLAREAGAQQIVLSNNRGLDFGRFVAGSGGTVVINPNGSRSRTGGVVLLNSPGAGQAVYSVGKSSNGNGAKAVIVSLPANGSIRLTSGNSSMAVGGFVNAPAALLTVPAGGTTLSLGATLTVAPNQPPGKYTGSFPLIVNFQ